MGLNRSVAWRRPAKLVLVCVALLALPVFAVQQTKPSQQPPKGTAVDKQRQRGQDEEGPQIGTDLVELDVSVIDRANKPVFDIPKERFTVFEDGGKQTVSLFKKEEAAARRAL